MNADSFEGMRRGKLLGEVPERCLLLLKMILNWIHRQAARSHDLDRKRDEDRGCRVIMKI